MARNPLHKRHERKIQKATNGSYRITLPIEVIRELRWRDGQKIVVKKRGQGIAIEDWKA